MGPLEFWAGEQMGLLGSGGGVGVGGITFRMEWALASAAHWRILGPQA